MAAALVAAPLWALASAIAQAVPASPPPPHPIDHVIAVLAGGRSPVPAFTAIHSTQDLHDGAAYIRNDLVADQEQ